MAGPSVIVASGAQSPSSRACSSFTVVWQICRVLGRFLCCVGALRKVAGRCRWRCTRVGFELCRVHPQGSSGCPGRPLSVTVWFSLQCFHG